MSNFINAEQFETEPSVNIGRSTFTGLSRGNTTDLTQGDISPVFFEEVLPGDTFQIKTSYLVRMSTPVFPVMGNAFLDMFWFFVPNRLVWDKYKEFLGENTAAPWVQTVEYTIPQLKFNHVFSLGTHKAGVIRNGSLMNRLLCSSGFYPGINQSVLSSGEYLSVSDLPNRAYRLIWNEFFRDQNVEYPVPVYTDSSDRSYWIEYNIEDQEPDYGDKLLKANRVHDYFSSVLPGPQKSLTPVPASLLVDKIPVYSLNVQQDFTDLSDVSPLHFARYVNGVWNHASAGNNFNLYADTGSTQRGSVETAPTGNILAFTPDNLYARASDITFATVNSLRQSFAIQRFYEQQARTGSRMREILQGFFNVESPDASMQIPEYLGGNRVPINIDQVLQTSSTDAVSPQGNVSGYSLTTDVDGSFIKSFTEPGMLFGLAVVRVQHVYPQSIRPYWFRKRRFDFYWPQFANLSEQPVFKKFLCATGIDSVDDSVFGYQEAFADYRYCPNQMSGVFSPETFYDSDANKIYEQQSSLAGAWTFSDYYQMNYQDARGESGLDPTLLDSVTLSPEWMTEPDSNVAQTLAVPSEPQFIADFWFDVKSTRPMPVRSIPGLIDHH